jgi:hypothetical protein
MTEENLNIGAFCGYIRRPIPSQQGMLAQIFGENGDDADTILALSLSKFQDIEVSVNIYLIKNADGKNMKENDKYPVISSFVGYIRRSLPKKDGMIAQIFSPNGIHSDSISILSKTEYLDALVFVDIKKPQAQTDNNEVTLEIDNNHLTKITLEEKKELLKKEKQWAKDWEKIKTSEFFFNETIIKSIGAPEEFKEWLVNNKPCLVTNELCKNATIPLISTVGYVNYNYYPVCESHKNKFIEDLDKNNLFYEMKYRLLIKEWVWSKIQQKFKNTVINTPDLDKAITWFKELKIDIFLPKI